MKLTFNNIRAEIARNRLTIEQFCEKLGIDKSTFYNWEAKGDLPASYVLQMSKMFEVSTDYLLS
jgi:predicted DNA-binding transcriptional regulator AlpA